MQAGDGVGDETAFTTLVQRHRRELRVHCYRMLGSYDEAEDLVQETFLRAWKGMSSFEGRSSVRAWLYRIATNACLDVLDSRSRRVLPPDLRPPSDASADLPPRTDLPWLQPFPDRMWEPVASEDADPAAVAVTRETIELAFLAALHHLPPRQRAALLLFDVLGWRAAQIAPVLGGSVASVNSALQRARATLRERLPERRAEWAAATGATPEERAVLRRYMDAVERADLDTVAALLAEDVRTSMPPWPMWFRGRDTVLAALATSWDPTAPHYVGRFKVLPVRANAQPAAAAYLRAPGDTVHHAFAVSVLRIEDGLVVEATAFHDTGLFPAFGLPMTLPAALAPPDR
ncbi:sigma-70 family RNA polymerase sigma factor [Pseudonocardia sichuanensis]|uniref:RNA polymerase sigma factor n=1 Tax=Pseudonocardia kunmingensis TaxID=630975 RepID=A0A543DW67_9PSEU|nr:sigma-70 family RNA polymerase sigma factor [Pseudonocardia kunmingensis]TQM13568.1 RNA polymerase sigma-70 factor (ECF subfamily) [Pseudonocardia kunmingensis]